MTPVERELLLKELDHTRERLWRIIQGLTPEQLEYREAPDRWSIAENLEHIILAEQFTLGLVQKILQDAPDSARSPDSSDERLRNTLAESRRDKLRAPDMLKPMGRWPLAELWPEFEATRKRTREFIAAASEDLRRRSAPHFRFGRLDGCQWLVLIGSHCDRHCAQSERLKASAGFPR
jgi:hypothetical protein